MAGYTPALSSINEEVFKLGIRVVCELCSNEPKMRLVFPTKKKYQEHYKEFHKKKKVRGNVEKKIRRKKRINMAPELRVEIKKKYKGKCAICGSKQELQIHHKIHVKNGGTNEISNLILLCELCHSEQHRGEPIYNLMIKRIFKPIKIS